MAEAPGLNCCSSTTSAVASASTVCLTGSLLRQLISTSKLFGTSLHTYAHSLQHSDSPVACVRSAPGRHLRQLPS